MRMMGATLKQIGSKLGVTRERARQLIIAARKNGGVSSSLDDLGLFIRIFKEKYPGISIELILKR